MQIKTFFSQLLLLGMLSGVAGAAPMGTAFTYQGKLASGTNAANGIYDFSFALYDAASDGAQKGGTLTTNAVPVANGYFMVTLDFGNVFPGDARWLEVSVKTNGAVSYTLLTPRQPLMAVPYALSASNVLGNVPAVQLSGTVANSQLANNTVTVTAGTGLSGGGPISLGGSTTLNNAGVLSVTGNADITATPSSGAVTLGDTATDANTASRIVKRDASGDFSAGSITLAGNLSLPATTASAGKITSGGSTMLHAYGTQNIFAGASAGNFAMTGGQNSAIGYGALALNTSGADNTALGAYALYFNTNGFDNTAVGQQALMSNKSGPGNTAVGSFALKLNAAGTNNTASGDSALASNTNGSYNTANGSYALYANLGGIGNTASGNGALLNNTSGNYNTALGTSAGQSVVGNYNTALGAFAGQNLTTGHDNIDIGNLGQAGDNQTIRLGTQGTQTNTFIAGIYNNTVPAGAPVYVDSSGHLGTGANSPVALLNGNQTFTGTVTFNNAANTFTGNGSGLTGLNASQLISGAVPMSALGNAWKTSGNAGTTSANFVGTTDNQPLEFRTYNTRALRLEYNNSYANLTVYPAGNSVATYGSTIAGGYNNQIQTGSYLSFIGGGVGNEIQGSSGHGAVYGVIGGGYDNIIEPYGFYSSIGGGYENRLQYDANYSAILSGKQNLIGTNQYYSVIAGGTANRISTNASSSTICGGANNFIGSSDVGAVIAGGHFNEIRGFEPPIPEIGEPPLNYATISGGLSNTIFGWSGPNGGTIGGGILNQIAGTASTVGGGYLNTAYGNYAATSGGMSNSASGAGAFIGGGGYDGSSILGNTATGAGSVIAGGTQNIASGSRSTVDGGHNNFATNWYATVPGGAWNVAGGQGSFAAGRAAKAVHDGAFVWSDSDSSDVVSTSAKSVTMRASGGYRLFSNNGMTSGVYLAPGGGAWTSVSDRNAKENFAAVDPQAILAKVATLPLSTWNYKSQDAAIRHIGPMAQDFKAAFGIGESDTGISTVDADGVALAAIQGLNQKLNEKDAEIADLKARLEKLEQLVLAADGGAK